MCAGPQEAMLSKVALWKEFLQGVERESSLPRALWKKKDTSRFVLCISAGRKTTAHAQKCVHARQASRSFLSVLEENGFLLLKGISLGR